MTTSYSLATYASTFRSNTTTHPMIPKGTNTGTITQDRAYLPTYQLQGLLCFDRTHSKLTLVGGQITEKNVKNKDTHTRAIQFGFIPPATAEFARAAARRALTASCDYVQLARFSPINNL